MSNIIHVDFKANKPKWEEYEFTIGTHYAPVIENGDNSELDQDEITNLDQFLSEFNSPMFDWETEDDSIFTRCDITGLMLDCWRVTVLDRLGKQEVI